MLTRLSIEQGQALTNRCAHELSRVAQSCNNSKKKKGGTNGSTDQRTNRRTHPLIERRDLKLSREYCVGDSPWRGVKEQDDECRDDTDDQKDDQRFPEPARNDILRLFYREDTVGLRAKEVEFEGRE